MLVAVLITICLTVELSQNQAREVTPVVWMASVRLVGVPQGHGQWEGPKPLATMVCHDEPTQPKTWAALRMFDTMPPPKRFNRFNKLK